MFEWLTNREMLVIALVYGINHRGGSMTLTELAKAMGVSITVVSRVLSSGLAKLATPGTQDALRHLAEMPMTALSSEAQEPA